MDIFNKNKIKELEDEIYDLEDEIIKLRKENKQSFKNEFLKKIEWCWPTLTQQELKNLINNL